MSKQPTGVEAVDKALKVIDCFKEHKELTLTEISKLTKFYKSTVFRIIGSLTNSSYLIKDFDGKYCLGPSFHKLKIDYGRSSFLKENIQKELEIISNQSNETAAFFIKQKENRICMLTKLPDKIIKHNLEVGDTRPLDKGSSGKIISAFMNLKIKNKEDILNKHYAISIGDRDQEIGSVSVPLITSKDKFLGSITVSGHISNFNKKNCLRFLSILNKSRNKLEQTI